MRWSCHRLQKPLQQYWTDVALGRSGAWLTLLNGARDGWSAVQLSISGPNASVQLDAIRQQHGAQLENIANQLGAQIEWRDEPDKKIKLCLLRRSSNLPDRSTWPDLNEWLARAVEQLHTLLSPIVRAPNFAELGGSPRT